MFSYAGIFKRAEPRLKIRMNWIMWKHWFRFWRRFCAFYERRHQKWHFTQFRFKQASTGHDTFSPVNDADFLIFSLSLKYAQSRFFYEGFKISAYQSFNSSVLKSRLDCIRFHGFITWDSMQPVMIHSHCACGCSAGFTRWFHHWQYRIHIHIDAIDAINGNICISRMEEQLHF